MSKAIIASSLALTLTFLAPVAQAESFFVTLLRGANWQAPKCKAPEVLTQVKDRAGNIRFLCQAPKSSK